MNHFFGKYFNIHKIQLARGRLNTGMLFVVLIMLFVTAFAFILTGGTFPKSPLDSGSGNFLSQQQSNSPTIVPQGPPGSQQQIILTQNSDKENLQLYTFTVKSCQQPVAIDFLIDTSGSMQSGNKIGKEKDALKAFIAKMTDSSVIGIHTFNNNRQENIPISFYKDVKTQIPKVIDGLKPTGFTHTRSAFELVKEKVLQAKNNPKFAGYKFSIVFLSDGVPEVGGITQNSTNCLIIKSGRCFARAQDPRVPTNIAQEIKSQGVEIYSIAITDSKDQTMKAELIQLFKDVSSEPDTTYFYESVDGNNLKTVLDRVFTEICN